MSKKSNLHIPTLVKSLEKKYIFTMCCGWTHTIVVVEPNAVYVCGSNKKGEAGVIGKRKYRSFTLVKELNRKNIQKVFAGGHHSFFLLDYDE